MLRWISISVLILGISCGRDEKTAETERVTMKLSSPAFVDGGFIPEKHTCEGEDLSPPLSWSDLPEGTKSLTLICEDPDAPMGTWVHWVIFNIPPDSDGLPEGVPQDGELPDGTRQGINDFGRIGYNGPCPPPGKAHRYYFKLYALDAKLELNPGVTEDQVLRKIEGHILAQAQLMGRYQRGR